jgi:hypothetical protein
MILALIHMGKIRVFAVSNYCSSEFRPYSVQDWYVDKKSMAFCITDEGTVMAVLAFVVSIT